MAGRSTKQISDAVKAVQDAQVIADNLSAQAIIVAKNLQDAINALGKILDPGDQKSDEEINVYTTIQGGNEFLAKSVKNNSGKYTVEFRDMGPPDISP